LIKNI